MATIFLDQRVRLVVRFHYVRFALLKVILFYQVDTILLLTFKCKVCGLQFEEEKRLRIHKKVHGRKPKISEYGSPEFNQDRLRG